MNDWFAMPDVDMLVDGAPLPVEDRIEVRNPATGERVGSVGRGTLAHVDLAMSAAVRSLAVDFPAHERHRVLLTAADRVESGAEEYALTIAREGSKTIREARREPLRAAEILRMSAAEAHRLGGETLPYDARPGSEERIGYYYRVPVGVVSAILPFNDPLAVAAHKVGPAIAAGNAVVLKPDSRTPISPLMLAADLIAAGLPKGRLNVVTGHGEEIGDALVTDPRVRLVAFTGGVETGDRISRRAGIKKLLLELGANSPVIVHHDADLDRAAKAVVAGAFAQAGQNCLGVQRVLVHDRVYEAFRDQVVERSAALRVGPSTDVSTDVCSMISVTEAERVDRWVAEAVASGARLLIGGRRDGALFRPTVLEDVPSGCMLDREEVYGPVLGLYHYESLDKAIERANATDYGLHGAVFTESLSVAFHVVSHLDVGTVIVNDSTDYRLDLMPFGGRKRSGFGREGIRHAVEEMTETRVVCLNL